MAKMDEPWNPEVEKPLAIAIASGYGNRSAQIVMTTSRGRVLVKADSTDGLWHDITPKMVRTEYVKKPQTDYKPGY